MDSSLPQLGYEQRCQTHSPIRLPIIAAIMHGATLAFLVSLAAAAAPKKVQFNRDIRPILSENCFFCHGPDKSKRKAGLRLDVREAALEDGAIVPGKPGDSELIARINTKDPDDVMPPPLSHKTLKPQQVAMLTRWIADGAAYQPHWAYVPVRKAKTPATRDQAWGKTPVDAFVQAALDERDVRPSAPADRRTLLRRLSLDLTGLPPTPEELTAFTADTRPDAWEGQVDRLLASPHYGERMAVPWLDVARFADTVGYHGDQNQHVLAYREYVINSFNRNKPFDQFTIEQLAGDLLPKPTTEQLIATGFNRLNMVTREGGAQAKEYLAKYMADRVRAVGTVWMGSTLGCSECHDHKFDPFTARDFYAMGAFFADVKQWGVYSDYKYTPNPDLKGFTNDYPFPPEITVESPYLKARSQRLQAELGTLADQLRARLAASRDETREFRSWQDGTRRFLAQYPDGWRPAPALPEKKQATGMVRIAPGSGWLSAIRIDLATPPDYKGPDAELGRKIGVVSVSVTHNDQAIRFHFADSATKEPHYLGGHEQAGIASGWVVPRAKAGQTRTGVWELAQPVRVGIGDTLTVTLKGEAVGTVKVFTSPFATFGTQAPSRLAAGKRFAAKGRVLDEVYLLSTGWAKDEARRFQDVHRQLAELRGGLTPTLVTQTVTPYTTRLLPRGNWQDDSGPVVDPATPQFLPAPVNPDKRRLTRLDLARWLVSRDNPLTSRTLVNRIWKHLFGAGLSPQLDDLGAQGEPPSHPDLLDWLAADLVESGWDIKRLVRLIVTSSVYRQDSTARPELREVDPANRLLARQSQRRLDAEFVRDNALFAANLLNLEIGGPSAFPYQPAGYLENLEFPKRDWYAEKDERQYRRGLYTHWQRTFVHPMLANFDAPSREECTADRPPSNTPQQALTLLNDPTFVEAARVFAQNLLVLKDLDDATRIGRAFERGLGRPAKPDETASLLKLLGAHREHYGQHIEDARKLVAVGIAPRPELDAAEHASWTSVCRVILNLYDAVTRL